MWQSGFFNSIRKDGVLDRLYNANDYSNALSFIVGNGIVNALDGTSFQVVRTNVTSAAYGLTIKKGWAWINGKWVNNDADDSTSSVGDYTLNSIAMTVKNYKRIDRVFIRRDDSIEVRNIHPVLRKSSEARELVTDVPEPIREGEIYEICIAEIHIDYTGDTPIVTVYDKRADKELCGWVNGYFGDNWEQYCKTISNVVDTYVMNSTNSINNYVNTKTNEFNSWFGEVREQVASVTLLKPLINTVTVSTAGRTFSIGIAEYNPAIDLLEVYTNGIYEKPTDDYTIDTTNKTVTFSIQKAAGAVIDFIVTKAIDGRFYENPDVSLVASVEGRLTDIETRLTETEEVYEQFTYIATGENDNIKLCEKIKTFMAGNLTDRRMLQVNVVSTDKEFTVTQPCYTGAQSGLETYNRYFDFSITGTTSRRFILNFANCSPINIAIPNNTLNIIFYGANQKIENCVLKAGSTENTGTKIVGIYGTNDVHYKNCRISITASSSLEFAYHGIYEDCEVTLTSLTGNATAFYPRPNGDIVQVIRGVYFLFTTQSAVDNGFNTKLIYHSLQGEASSTAVSICRDVLIPSPTRTGYVSAGYVFHTTGGYLRAYNTISARANNITNTNSEILGTIPLSRGKGQTPFI